LAPAQRTEEALLALLEDGWRALSAGYHRIPGVEQHYSNSVRQLKNYMRQFDYAAEPYMVEPYLQVDLAPGVTLFGRLDRLDENPDGTLHIIDYKGGSLPGDVDSSQLVFYAVMAEIKLERRVTRASFWYLDDGATWTIELSEADKERARMELLATIDEMTETNDFPPTISPNCAGCPYLHGCEVRSQIDATRGREGW
jgi:putative RecB family exonuclease